LNHTLWGLLSVLLYSEPVIKKTKNDPDDSEDEFEKLEAERMQDLNERDAFASRLKEKDKEKTRQVMSKTERKVSLYK